MFWQILKLLGVAGTKEVSLDVLAFFLRQLPGLRRVFIARAVVTNGWGPSNRRIAKGAATLDLPKA